MKTLSSETAVRVWQAHQEIKTAEKLLSEIKDAMAKGEDPNPRDGFGRRRNLQLGVPMGENSHRLFNLHPELAVCILEGHIANQQQELVNASIAARVELNGTMEQSNG